MNQTEMIEDLVKLLDNNIINGVGHINVEYNNAASAPKEVQTLGCSDLSKVPLACSVPTLHEGLDNL